MHLLKWVSMHTYTGRSCREAIAAAEKEGNKMNNIAKISCMHFWSDWTEIKEIEIDLDEWVFFSVEYRGKDNWHVIGYKCENHNWTTTELSDHQVTSIYDLAEFIVQANTYVGKKFQPCKVSRFNNLHYSGSFYDDLSKLLELVKKYEAEQALKEMERNE